MQTLKIALESAAALVTALTDDNAVSLLAWWQGEQYLTFYPVDLVRRYHRTSSEKVISEYIHEQVIGQGLTLEVGRVSLWLPDWKERKKTMLWKPGERAPDLSGALNLPWLDSFRHPDAPYSRAVAAWCRSLLPVASREDVALLQIPPAVVKPRYGRSEAILRMAYFPEVREMIPCEV